MTPVKLSILIPAYNERQTISKLIGKLLEIKLEKEIIVIDDGSTDGTSEMLCRMPEAGVLLIRHPKNQGKGAAIRTGLAHVTGDIVVIQDADLDQDYGVIYELLGPILTGGAQMVYGSRFLKMRPKMKAANYAANRFLSFLTGFLYRAKVTDVETCFKAFSAGMLKSLGLKSNGFEFEIEVTAKALKRGFVLQEVPIKQEWYQENHHDSKKLNWTDGVKAVIALFRYRFRD